MKNIEERHGICISEARFINDAITELDCHMISDKLHKFKLKLTQVIYDGNKFIV